MDDFYVSIHGICFDEVNSGRCGIECRGFDDCDERENIIDEAIKSGITADTLIDLEVFDSDVEIYEAGLFHEYLINKYIGEFRLGVLMAQSKFEFNKTEFLEHRLYKNEKQE